MISRYWKAIVAAVTPVFLVVQSAVVDDAFSSEELVAIGVAALTALGVFGVRNEV